MIDAILNYQYLQNALLSSLLASVVCGLIGVVVIEKKLVMMTGGIAHTAYGGVGLGYLLGFTPIYGALIFAILAALGIGKLKTKGSDRSDIAIGMFWSLGMALGILFIGLTPGYPPDMSSYLFGNILSVTKSDLNLMIILTIFVSFFIVSLFNDWKAYIFDEEFAEILGVKTNLLEYLLLLLIALTSVVLIRVAGIVLVLALLTAPAATSILLSQNFKSRMIIAIAFGAIYSIAGLIMSYHLDISSGASIVIISVTSYLLIFIVRALFLKSQGGR